MTAEELLSLFREYFPEFDSEPDGKVLRYLNLALSIHAICQDATIYLAAHFITLDNASGVGGSGGSVDGGLGEKTSERAKNVAATYKAQAMNDGDSFYTTTPYGRMYIAQRDACPGRRFSVRVV